MDVYSGKRAVNGPLVPRRGRDSPNNTDETVHLCSQLECSGPLNHSKSSQVGVTEKHRPPRPTFNSSNRKDMVDSSSLALTNVRKGHQESRTKTFSQIKNDNSEVGSLNGLPEVTEHMQLSPEYQVLFNSAARDNGASKARSAEVGHSSGTSTSEPRKITRHKSASNNQQTAMHSSISSTSKVAVSQKRPCSNGAGQGLRNLKCNSTPVVPSQNCSTSESRFSRTHMAKSRNKGESSSSTKGNRMIEASPKETHVSCPTRGISISDSGVGSLNGLPEVTEHMQLSPEYQLLFNSAARDNGASKARSTEVGHSSGTSTSEPRKITRHESASNNQQTAMHSSISSTSKVAVSQKRPCSNGAGQGLRNLKCNSTPAVPSQNYSTSESRFSRTDMAKSRNKGESSSSTKGNRMIEASLKERHVSRPTRGISISDPRGSRNLEYSVDNHVGQIQNRRPVNVNSRFRGTVCNSQQTESSGLAQNLRQSETRNLNLLFSRQPSTGGSSSDRYRDMRLDIDNMSYEDLLALGEWIGTVSTTLSEEALSKCIRRSIYLGIQAEVGAAGGGDEDEIKCSICLEDYVVGDEIGELECKHGYHVECVQQWLKLKNWCPICKVSAASSDSELTKMASRMHEFIWMGGFFIFSFFLIFYILSHSSNF